MKKVALRSILLLIVIALISGCAGTPPAPQPPPTHTTEATTPAIVAETATPAPTPTPRPTIELDPIAPVVLRTSPEEGAEQPLNTPLEITFDQPMERSSVEQALVMEPDEFMAESFAWVDDQTLQFTPKASLVRGGRYKLTILDSATSQKGLAMLRPFELTFNAAGFLEVTNTQPPAGASEVLADTTVTVLFNRPVAPLGAIADAGELPHPLTFTPPVEGQGEWLNTSIYRFTPTDGFAPATDYTARVAAGLTDALGQAALVEDFTWSFTTISPAVAGSYPAPGDIYVSPSPVISVAFNQPMNRPAVEAGLRLLSDATGDPIPGQFTWADAGLTPPASEMDPYSYEGSESDGPAVVGVETVAFRPTENLAPGAAYRLELAAGIPAAATQAATQQEFAASFTVSPLPAILSTTPQNGEQFVDPYTSLEVTFSAPMNPASLIPGETLLIEPATLAATDVYSYWANNDTWFSLSLPTRPNEAYTITLTGDIEGRYGHKLGQSRTIVWQTRQQSPLVDLVSPSIATYNANTETRAYMTVRNVSQVNLALYHLSQDDFIQLGAKSYGGWTNYEWEQYEPPPNNLLRAWDEETDPDAYTNTIYPVSLAAEAGDSLAPGLYYLEASAAPDGIYPEAQQAGLEEATDRVILIVSRHNITLKQTGTELLAWLTDLQTGQPVPGVPITFMLPGEELGVAETDADGVAFIAYEPQTEVDPYATSYLAFAGPPDNPDENFAVSSVDWSSSIDRYQFPNLLIEDYRKPYNAYFYTDRNIYRPGQTVYFKGILRADDDSHYSLPPAGKTVKVSLEHQGKEIFSLDLPLNDMGTVKGAFPLSEKAGLGYYTLKAAYNDEEFYFYEEFQVAAFRKPEFLVEVTTDQPQYVQGDTVKVTAVAEYLFGGPVAGAQVSWKALADDYFFNYQGQSFYDFIDEEYNQTFPPEYIYGYGVLIAEGEGITDNAGRFTFDVPAGIADKLLSQQFTLDVAVTDLNNQEVAGRAMSVVNKGRFYIGLRPEQYVNVVGAESVINLLTVDWESAPFPGQEVELVFAEYNLYSVQQAGGGSFYWENTVEEIPVFTTSVTTDKNGQATSRFVPTKAGLYRITATSTDGDSNEVRASTFMWVSGGGEYVNWGQADNDRIELVPDKHTYNVGDVAQILVPHPFGGPVQVLVTLERGHIYEYFVIELESNSQQIPIPITAEMTPNMYVSAVIVKGVDETNPLPSFRLGYASLPINPTEKQLQITLTPNKPAGETYQPQEKVSYQIKVTDAAGQPVKAELSLALVDKAILALAPEPPGQLLDRFWQRRGLGVKTGGGLTLAIDRINQAIDKKKGGGGGGGPEGFSSIREDLADAVLWVADFTTDEQGEGSVEAELPDTLTTWTLTAVGVTGDDTLVGDSTVEIVSTKPLLVRPQTPRFFVAGDKARLGLTIQNNSDTPLEVTPRFVAEGLTIADDGLAPAVTVEAGGQAKVTYDVTAGDATVARLTMGAQGGDLSDAVAFELPIYRYSSPESVATVGILGEDGTRAEAIALPETFDPHAGQLLVTLDPSLAATMRDGLNYLEAYPHEGTEQVVSRFLPNLFTLRAYRQLGLKNPELEEKLPDLVSAGLQRLYSDQHFDGGWGWWVEDESDPFLTAYVLLGLVEAKRADFAVDEYVMTSATDYLNNSLVAPKDVAAPWQGNRQAFILYVLAEAGAGDLGRTVALFETREQLDLFGLAHLALALNLLDPASPQIETLLSDLSAGAIVSATGTHWEEAQADFFSMNTDTRSTAIIIATLARLQPDNALLPNAVRWLMSVRENGGHWETTQENAWAIIGLTDWLSATGELEASYTWSVALNGYGLDEGVVVPENLDETVKLEVTVRELLAGQINQLAIERSPVGGGSSTGSLYYAAYLTYYLPAEAVKPLERGIIVSRQYRLQGDKSGQPITSAKAGDVIEVSLTIVAPNDLHYVVVEDPFPAGAEAIDTNLAVTSVPDAQQMPEMEAIRSTPWEEEDYGRWAFSHTELHHEKAVLYATYLPKGTYKYTYPLRASVPGEYHVIPAHAAQTYFPEVFGRSDGGVLTITE